MKSHQSYGPSSLMAFSREKGFMWYLSYHVQKEAEYWLSVVFKGLSTTFFIMDT